MGDITSSSPRPGLTAPAPITKDHDTSQFDCGKAPMNDWLRRHALRNEGRADRTFVVCEDQRVIGYYALAAGSVSHADAPSALKRNMPNPIPVFVLGRLAVDRRYQGRRIGSSLLKDALRRFLTVSRDIGARAVLVHAIDTEVVPFYMQYGFKPFREGALTMFLSIDEIAAAL